jgi:hypothetical protein
MVVLMVEGRAPYGILGSWRSVRASPEEIVLMPDSYMPQPKKLGPYKKRVT